MSDSSVAETVGVLVVSPYAAFRAGLHALLGEAHGVEVIGHETGSADLADRLAMAHPDLVLIDSTPADGLASIAVATAAGIATVALTDVSDDVEALAASPLVGWGCLRREADGAEIAAAIRAAALGLIALDRTFLLSLSAREEDAADPEQPHDLTARERQVLELMAAGLPNKTIAGSLEISPHTAKFHVASILSKLGAASRAEAVTLGMRQGYLAL